MKKQLIIILSAIVLIAALGGTGYYVYQSNNKPATTQTQQKATVTTSADGKVSYQGRDGVTALALLQEGATIVSSGTGENAFVTTINGVEPNSKNQYWSFNVNGTPASVGAGSYVTKSTDTITWELSSF